MKKIRLFVACLLALVGSTCAPVYAEEAVSTAETATEAPIVAKSAVIVLNCDNVMGLIVATSKGDIVLIPAQVMAADSDGVKEFLKTVPPDKRSRLVVGKPQDCPVRT